MAFMMYTHPDGQPVLELDDEQSWKLLEATKHGRLVVSVSGEPDIFPVNYIASGRKIYLRTAPGNKLAQLTINSSVLLETDGILSDEAWSVVLSGTRRRRRTGPENLGAHAQGFLRGGCAHLCQRTAF